MELKYLSFLKEHKSILGLTEGLTAGEVTRLEHEFGVMLPKAYKEFLLDFGKRTGYLLSSYLVTVDKLKRNRESALMASINELDNKKVEINDNYFFFGQWQGYIFYFFDCSDRNENPPIYILTDSPEIKLYKDSFAQFVKDEGLMPLLK